MSFIAKLLTSRNPASSKRFVTLIIAAHFILASFVILFVAVYLIFYLPKGKADPVILGMLDNIIEKDFYIILSGLGFVTIENFGAMMVEYIKGKTSVKPPKEETDGHSDSIEDSEITPRRKRGGS